MRIERVDIIHVQIPLLLPYETSYHPNLNVDKIVLKVYTPDAVVFSECVCKNVPGSTYETPGTVRVMLNDFFLPALKGRDFQGPEEFWELMKPFKGHNMAKAGLDNAVWVLKALERETSLAKLLGGAKDRVPVGHGVGVQKSVENALDIIGQYLDKGYTRIKMKIKPGWDLHILEAVRKAYPDLPLMVDANTAYRYPEDVEHLKALDRFNLVMLEQPLTWEDLYFHARLQEAIETPVCLDESVWGPYTAQIATILGSCRVINIKQGRCGGLTPSLAVHDIAQDAGIGCWVGQMIETGLGLTYGLAVASLSNCTFHNDLMPALDYITEDIIDPPMRLNSDGTVNVPNKLGLGVDVNEKVLDRYTVAKQVVRL